MYIYGILNSNVSLYLSIPKGLLLLLEESESNGVYTIAYQDISAVVSDSEMIDYTHMRKDRLAMFLVRHQKALENIMSLGHTIIPMRLGTFAKNIEEIKHILACGHSTIKDVFNKILNMIEIDVVATWGDFNLVLKEIREGKEIKEFKERLLASPGGVTVDDQMKVGLMVKEALDRIREGYSKRIQASLKSVSQAFNAHELMDDKMVVNIAFLIDKDRREDFDKKVEELNTEFAEKLNFRCVGPLPPYSFYTLEIKTLNYEDVDWAKKKLGILNDITSKNELKKAYQRQALSTHPDRNPNMPCVEKEFDEVNKAYKILADYCAANEQANQKENAMLVRVRE
ncbi:MAG TPA: hypothetical protein DCY56_02695 [Candidatus Omnitrophica bacterium]|nr:hypothetical protein [Candidatus Omnitrophota bacterium]